MSVLWLTVEASPGSAIEDACNDAVRLADRMGVSVWFDFNGVKCLARPGDNPQRMHDSWYLEFHSDKPHKIASDKGKP